MEGEDCYFKVVLVDDGGDELAKEVISVSEDSWVQKRLY